MNSSAHDQITVILVTYNSSGILEQALEPLRQHAQVIVVDNGSEDGTAQRVRAQLPQALLIENPANIGYGRANNLALERVQTPFALLLNPDCRLQPGTLEALLAAALRYPEAALLSPKLYDAPGQLGLCYRPAFYKPQPAAVDDPAGDVCADFLSGAALLLRMQTMRSVGFFDPWFFLYMEDDDLCERTRRAGHALVLVADAAVLHRARQSSRPNPELAFRRDYCLTLSKFYIQRKYFGTARAALVWTRVLIGSLLALPLHLFSRRRRTRTLARLLAALLAPRELRAQRCYVREG